MEVRTLTKEQILALEPVSEVESLSNLEKSLVEVFAREPRLFSAFILIRRKDGTVRILDGRHRRAALPSRPDGEVFPVVIYDEDEVGEVSKAVSKLAVLRRSPSLKEITRLFEEDLSVQPESSPPSSFPPSEPLKDEPQEPDRDQQELLLFKEKAESLEIELREKEAQLQEAQELLSSLDDERAKAEKRAYELEAQVKELSQKLKETQAFLEDHRTKLKEEIREELSAKFEREKRELQIELTKLQKELEKARTLAEEKERRALELARREYEKKLQKVKGVIWEQLTETEREVFQRFFYQIESLKDTAAQFVQLEIALEDVESIGVLLKTFVKTTVDVLNMIEGSARDTKERIVEKYFPQGLKTDDSSEPDGEA